MPVIESKIMINSKSFKKNQQDHAKLIDEVRTLEKKIADNKHLVLEAPSLRSWVFVHTVEKKNCRQHAPSSRST